MAVFKFKNTLEYEQSLAVANQLVDEVNYTFCHTKEFNICTDEFTLNYKLYQIIEQAFKSFEAKITFRKITIPGVAKDSYFITRNGIVLSTRRVKKDKPLLIMKVKNSSTNRALIALKIDEDYYKANDIPINNNDKHFYTSIPKLVLLTWRPEDISYQKMMSPIIKHRDNNPYNNDVDNLYWLEKLDDDPFNMGKIKHNITPEKVKEIANYIRRSKDDSRESMCEIARICNVTPGTVARIKYGESWTKFSGISKGEYIPPAGPEFLTDDEIKLISDLILDRKTDQEISDLTGFSITRIYGIRNKKSYIDKTKGLDFIKTRDMQYINDVIGNKGDQEITINDDTYKLITIPNVLENKYYINKSGIVEIVNWNIKRSKELYCNDHQNGKILYHQYNLKRSEEPNNDDHLVVRKEILQEYYWNGAVNKDLMKFDIIKTGQGVINNGFDTYTGEKLKRPSPLTHEKAEEIAKYIVAHPDTSVKDLAKIFNISKDSVGHLKSGDTFKDICKKYNLTRYVRAMKDRISNDKILEIANYIISHPDETNVKVSELFGVSKHMIVDIRTKRNYTRLLKDFEFNSKPREQFSYADKCKIFKLHNEGLSNSEIGKMFNRSKFIIKGLFSSKFYQEYLTLINIPVYIPELPNSYYDLNVTKQLTPYNCKVDEDGYAS